MSSDEENVLSVQLVPSFLPPFLYFLFFSFSLSYHLHFSSAGFFCCYKMFLFNHSLSRLLFFPLDFKHTVCVYILTTLTSSSLFIVYIYLYIFIRSRTTSRKQRERERKKLELESFRFYYDNDKNIYVWIRRRGWRSYASVVLLFSPPTVQSTRTYHTHTT